MARAALMLPVVGIVGLVWAEDSGRRLAPVYSPASIVNSASNEPGVFAPNSIVTIYGRELGGAVRALRPEDILNDQLPTVLPGTGVRVLVGKLLASIYFVSPGQVNLLIPSTLLPGKTEVQLVTDGRAGPPVTITIEAAAPALYSHEPGFAVSTRVDGSAVTRDSPVKPGEHIVLYATGLGQTSPPVRNGEVTRKPAGLAEPGQFELLLNGSRLLPELLLYAGLTPGFGGLYQINLKWPESAGADPEVQIKMAGRSSPAGIRVPALTH